MLDSIKNNLLLIFTLAILTIADICGYFLLEHQALFLLFSFLIALSWYRPSLMALIAGSCLLATESFIIYESIAWPFYLAGIILIASLFLKDHLYDTPLYPTLMGGFYLLPATYYTSFYGTYTPWDTYTVGIISANLVIIGLFSLKLKTSKTGQSLMPLA